ncbi:MAG: terminase family protein [Sphingomonas sp.]|uniref:DNA-packaging protein n=1 Tax=Sphingomonas sp. TaxID=28214 RepID=UPI0025D81C75|nr:terminase family protein [Sphingomonas sp.]MBX9880659.1 terminase family protein [Sphingomonas sp.]
MTPKTDALLARLLALTPAERAELVRALRPAEQREFVERWWFWAHRGQLAPPGDWHVWLIRAGRGFGKTRAGAEWVSALARTHPDARIALVGATLDEARRVMVLGESGLLRVARHGEAPAWRASHNEVHFASGAIAQLFSAEAAEGLRGPEHHFAWADELGKWRGEAAWDNLLLGLRLGERPRALVTTTPRPTALMRRLLAMPGLVETHGATRDNPHLPRSFVEAAERLYAGTALGRQELAGELVEDLAGALWTRAGIEACRVAAAPGVRRVVIGVDPPGSAGGDACGIVVAALGEDGRGYVLADASVAGLAPEGWARAVATAAARCRADRVVAEKNHGGEMVGAVLRAANHRLPLQLVHASHGKHVRAEPVSMLYGEGKVAHVGRFEALEDQMCAFTAEGYAGRGSPDRADALVWALTALLLRRAGEAGVRRV